MSRYYRIDVSDPTTKKIIKTWTSLVNGIPDPNALAIELDLYVYSYAQPAGGSSVSIYGVSLQDIQQTSNFNGKTIQIYGGMSAGLPLADPSQQGLLVAGTIFQAFSNWVGTDMSMEFLITPLDESLDDPSNISFQWPAGTPLTDAITRTLQIAYPNMKKPIVNVNSNLILSYNVGHNAPTLEAFAQYLEDLTLGLVDPNFPGVQITVQDNQIIVYDATITPNNPRQLVITDFVGQPVWYAPGEASVTVVLRGDIQPSQFIKMPTGFQANPGTLITQPATLSQYGNRAIFQGPMQVRQIRHVGSNRSADGRSWVSIYTCILPGS